MKPGASNLFWALVGGALLGGLMFVVFHFQTGQTPSEQLARKATKLELAGQLRVALASAAEAEKSAVLAVTDEESKSFADQARDATNKAEEARAALAAQLQAAGTPPSENELLEKFSKSFAEFQRVDKELLELAVKNTNIKATALAFGPAAEAIAGLDGALARILAGSAKSTAANARPAMLAAAAADAAALRIQALLPVHIGEESDVKMAALEARMSQDDLEVQKDLKSLATLSPGAELEKASAAYAQFTSLRTQILSLSRENTNVRSLSISLNQKRRVTVVCQDTLAALEKAIADEVVPGVANTSRPR